MKIRFSVPKNQERVVVEADVSDQAVLHLASRFYNWVCFKLPFRVTVGKGNDKG